MVADRARAQLRAVAHDVVLERLDGQRVLRVQRLQPALRHAERVVAEIDLLRSPRSARTSGKSVIQQKRNAPCLDQVEFLGRAACAPRRRTFGAVLALAGGEEHRIAWLQPARGADRPRRGRLPGCARSAPSGRPRHRRCSRGRRHPRPAPSRSACRRSCAAATRRPAPGSRAPRRPSAAMRANSPKPEPAKCCVTSADPQRVAQVRLVGAVIQHRRVVRDAPERQRHRPRGPRRIPRTRRRSPARSCANTSSCVT